MARTMPAPRRVALLGKATRFFSSPGYKFSQLYDINHLHLPRLPIPNLSGTIGRYLESVRPLATAEEYAAHEALVRDFHATAGPILHAKLVDMDAAAAASGRYPYYYFEPVWDDGYLAARDPLPINTNPALVYDCKPGERDQLRVSARFIAAYALWVRRLREGNLAPEATAADMSQYFFQAGTGRVPRLNRDVAVSDAESRHVVVVHRDRFFRIDVIDSEGRHAPVPALEQALHLATQSLAPRTLIGRLTTCDRDHWARHRTLLEADPGNAQTLRDIDTALLVVVLDDAEPRSPVEGLGLWLKGVESRWYDKHQLIVTRNGLVGLNLEHAFADGMTWLRWMTDVWAAVNSDSALPAVPESSGAPQPIELRWDTPAEVLQAAREADVAFRATSDNCDLKALTLEVITRAEMKQRGMPPDATAQLAMQFAHFRLHGSVAPTYESCSTRSFFHGRTETIRSATLEARRFSEAMLDLHTGASHRWGLFKAAVAKHVRLAQEAAQGQGVDRHLMMLRILGKQEPHPFLLDPLFQRSATWRLSTSNISHPVLGPLCFGAVVPHGYGIGYSILPSRLSFSVASFKDNPATDTAAFVDSLDRSIRDIVALSESVARN
jgi:hypothetical protein